jgi:hypothetical protein
VTPHLSSEHRYNTDPLYRRLVETFMIAIAELQLTPSEVRESAVYACIRFEERNFSKRLRNVHCLSLDELAEGSRVAAMRDAEASERRIRQIREWLASPGPDLEGGPSAPRPAGGGER